MHAAYVAGFIDADGCISINFRYRGRTPEGRQLTGRSVYFNVSVLAVQKNLCIVEMLHQQYGGGFNIVKRPGGFRYYRWEVSGKAALRVLNDIRPYVVDKKEQVALGILAIEHQMSCGRGRYRAGCKGTQPLSESDLDFRRAAWLRMKELNTCHKFRAAAETKSSDRESGCDSPALRVIVGDTAKVSAIA